MQALLITRARVIALVIRDCTHYSTVRPFKATYISAFNAPFNLAGACIQITAQLGWSPQRSNGPRYHNQPDTPVPSLASADGILSLPTSG
jgi:hypothetical protein